MLVGERAPWRRRELEDVRRSVAEGSKEAAYQRQRWTGGQDLKQDALPQDRQSHGQAQG